MCAVAIKPARYPITPFGSIKTASHQQQARHRFKHESMPGRNNSNQVKS
jgi:hypothetical protein